jgi:beta-glucosidase/6-phospho-beta-glucosidase/beta-galactosidase
MTHPTDAGLPPSVASGAPHGPGDAHIHDASPAVELEALISGTPPVTGAGTGAGPILWLPARSVEQPAHHRFMFATGIENSYPTVPGPGGGRIRIDEMAKTGHYARWREDFALVRELGIEYLRYGPPYHLTHVGPDRFDWDFADATFAEMRRLDIEPIVDLCHFGVPDWIGNFQNPDFPELFAAYAAAFARRYPWVRLYTPVNEIIITALFSGQLGWWNECLSSDTAFVTALKHLVRANLLAEDAILATRCTHDTVFVQSESSEYFHFADPAAAERAAFYNEKRFLSLDLCYGHDVSARMYRYLADHGMTSAQYDWFMQHGPRYRPYSVMGNDYYVTNEHMVAADGSVSPAGELFGYYLITKQYHDRYRLPVMHTETNHAEADHAVDWLQKQWLNLLQLKKDGVPVMGFTWYSLIDQVDWDIALREDRGTVNPRGLYDMDRRLRPVGAAYRDLVATWRDLLPTQSVYLGPPS